MLSDYIEVYKEAVKKNDAKEIKRIEKELASLGMDTMTLKILAKEV